MEIGHQGVRLQVGGDLLHLYPCRRALPEPRLQVLGIVGIRLESEGVMRDDQIAEGYQPEVKLIPGEAVHPQRLGV